MFIYKNTQRTIRTLTLLTTVSFGLSCVGIFAGASAAEEVGSNTALNNKEGVYLGAFFTQYSPQTAMDMIRRVPGFNFDGGDNVRGFGAGAGNVLVDGERPTSKNTKLKEFLERIPAGQVARIEIIHGGISGSEAAGQSVVANVIRNQKTGNGKWQIEPRRAHYGRILPNGNITYNSKQSGWDTVLDFQVSGDPRDQIATIVNHDISGGVTSVEDEIAPSHLLAFALGGEASHIVGSGKLTLSTSYESGVWKGKTTRQGHLGSDNSLASDYDSLWSLDGHNKWSKGELGVDWSRTLDNDWKWRMIGLGSFVKRNNGYALSKDDRLTDVGTSEDYRHKKLLTEFIARSTFAKAGGSAFKPEFGFEVAQNKYDNDINKIVDGSVVTLSNEDVVIEELRGETFATATYSLTPKFTLSGGVTAETSRVKVSGDTSQQQTFKFIKPRLSTTYSFRDDLQFTLEAAYKVGQLDLSDFAASSEEEDGLVSAGNPNLQPDKSSRVSAMIYWNFSERGSLKVEPFHEWRSDILEQVTLASGSAGLGNHGSARLWGINANLALPLEGVIKGGLLSTKLYLERSNFKDPLLGGLSRIVSAHKPGGRSKQPNVLTAEFRQDLTEYQLSWGTTVKTGYTEKVFLVDETQTLKRGMDVSAFIETTRFAGVKVRFEVTRANTSHETRTRIFYNGDRKSVISGSQIASRKKRPELRLQVTGTF